MKHGFGMLTLYVKDMQRAKEFYTEFLGMQFVARFSSDHFVLLRPVSGTQIALLPLSALREWVVPEPGGVEVNLEVEDVNEAWQEWKAKGVEVLTEVTDMKEGLWFHAKDPDGHIIAVYQLYPEFKDQ